jgi:hypothetical protein
VFKLSDKTVLGSTGCWCDILTFVKVIGFFSNRNFQQFFPVLVVVPRLKNVAKISIDSRYHNFSEV